MEKLTLEQIAPCLPYGLKGHFTNLPKGNLFTVSGYEIEDNEGVEDVFIIGSCGPYGGQRGLIETFVPYFLPLSSLTKPMEDGSVPIVVIGKMFGYHLHKFDCDGDVSYGWNERGYDDSQGYEFAWSENLKQFGVYLDIKDDEYGPVYNYLSIESIQYMAEMKINFMNLPEHLWIDVTTLPDNPYLIKL